VEAEAERLRWLGPRFPCPAVVLARGDWLVTTAPPGLPADRPERHPRPDDVPSGLGAALRQLHDLPAGDCPFDAEAGAVAGIEAALAADRLDPARLPPPYDRYPPARLVELLAQSAGAAGGTRAAPADRVVCHGAPGVGRWYLDGGRPGSVVGVHRLGLADRHLDLAVACRSLQLHFGPESVFGFLDGYGRDPDLVRLDHFILLDVLTAAIVDPAPPPGSPSVPAGRA
jgi:aminoglycoside phosphotransferase